MKRPPLKLLNSERTDNVAAVEEENELDLADLLAQLAARKWLIAILTVLGAFTGAFVGQLDPNAYRANSVVQIEKRDPGITLPSELIGTLVAPNSTANSSFGTEVHVIQSRLILGPVAEQLDVNTRIIPVRAPVIGDMLARRHVPYAERFLPSEYQLNDESVSLEELVISEDQLDTRIVLRVLGSDRFLLTTNGGVTVEGRVGEAVLLGEDIRVIISDISAPEGREYTLLREPLRNSVSRLRGALSVRERGGTGVVDFTFTSGAPEFSRSVVNAVVESYRARNLQRRSAEIDQSIAFIEQQLPEVRADFEAANEALALYRAEQDGLELSLGTQDILDRLIEIQTQLEELAFQEEQLAQRLTPNHPDYQQLIAERTRLEDRLAALREDLSDVPEAEQDLALLQERVAATAELEKQLTSRVEQLRVLKASTIGNIRVLEPSEVATLVGPDRRTPIAIGGGIGLVLAILLIFALNFLRRGIEDARDVEALGLSVFGSINKVSALDGKKSSDPLYGLALSKPDNVAVEALRGLRTGLNFTLAGRQAKTLMVTSCAPSDGKSFIALNLAIVSAKSGLRVLLIDADLRRGRLGRYFGVKRKSPGLVTALTNQSDFDLVTRDAKTGVDFMGTGGYPPNPAELLASSNFDKVLSSAKEHYDLVIVDAPPALAVADPVIIGQKTEVTLLVIRHLVTTKAEVQSAVKSLQNGGVTPAGVVINAYDMARSRYGQYGSKYGYHYGAYNYKYK